MSRLVFTSSPESQCLAERELRALLPKAGPAIWLQPGVGLLAPACSFPDASQLVRHSRCMFVRHICPVDTEVPLQLAPSDIEYLASATQPLAEALDTRFTFSVQTRLLGTGERPYGRFEVNEALAGTMGSTGARLDVRKPNQVLSVLLCPTTGYIGLSRTSENMSGWAGGEQRFRREGGQVSRAEFKLLEAFEVFGIDLQKGGTALDLGAAPGGWTRVLRSKGLTVTAIDPAALDPAIAADPGVLHKRQTTQTYLPTQDVFDIIVNDMRMDARDSSRIMGDAVKSLKVGGLGIITLKLPEESPDRTAFMAMELLNKWYSIEGARQLFHNRSEVTVALRRRG